MKLAEQMDTLCRGDFVGPVTGSKRGLEKINCLNRTKEKWKYSNGNVFTDLHLRARKDNPLHCTCPLRYRAWWQDGGEKGTRTGVGRGTCQCCKYTEKLVPDLLGKRRKDIDLLVWEWHQTQNKTLCFHFLWRSLKTVMELLVTSLPLSDDNDWMCVM